MSDTTELTKLSVPENKFISSYEIAENIVTQAVNSHSTYWQLIKDYQQHISGKRPIPPDELKKKGMSWAWNFNYGKARAKIEKGVAENVAKISSALALGYVTFRNKTKSDENHSILSFLVDDNKRGIVASTIGMSLATTLSKEFRLSGWLNEVEYPSYSFGYCALLFNNFDWMPEPTHPLNIAFKPNTKPDKIGTWVAFDVIEAMDLYVKWIRAREAEENEEEGDGWDLEGLEAVLLKAYKGRIKKDGNEKTPEYWQDVIPYYQDNPSLVISNTDSVSIAKIFYLELDGSITEVYIPWNNAWQVSENKPDEKGQSVPLASDNHVNNIIFYKNHPDFRQENYIGIIRDSGFTSESGNIQDLRGISKYAVEDSIRYNRIRNGMGNKMQFVGSPMFEQGAGQIDKFKITISQGFVILPSGHSLIEKQPSFDIASHINVLRFEESEYQRETQQFDATISGRLTSRPNRDEVNRITQEVELTESSKNNVKIRDYSAVFYSVLKRLHKIKLIEQDPGYDGRKRFYDNVKKNLPWLVESDADVDKILECIDSFVMEPVSTNIESITVAISMAETPYGRNRLKRMLLVAKGFPIEEVNFSVPLITDKYANLSDARVAAIENDMFFTTNEVIIAGTDDHIVHLDSHLDKSSRVIEASKNQTLSPIDAFKYLQNIIPHSENHIIMLAETPALMEAAQERQVMLRQIIKETNQIRIVAESMMKAQRQQEQQMQIDPETEAKIASKNAEVQASIQRKDWVAEKRTEQRDRQIEMDRELKEKKLSYEQE